MYKPWTEKYRPDTIDKIVLNDTNNIIINNMIDKDYYPNCIFYGPPGTGKTTTILCLINEYKKKHNCTKNYIHLNASHERGVDVIRTQIYNFCEKKNFFNDCRKFILLDEIDSMTKTAQQHLYNIIKNSNDNITFILICNYLNKIIDSITNSLFILHFNKTSLLCNEYIHACIKNEKINITKSKLELIKKNNIHDLRSIINNIQNYDTKDIIINDSIFYNLINNKNKSLLIIKNLKEITIQEFLFKFFQYIHLNYILDDKIVYMMKLLLLVNNDIDYVIKEFIPYINIKLNLRT
tara:strand:+ start:550 stop:1431 length:882 start_codon:yes stop_codon:yes gene_type:complete